MSIRVLPPALAEKALKELNEDPKRVKDDIQHIKDWLVKQPHLRARTDDQWIVTFLRGCKYSLERTKEKLDLYYSVRTAAPELFNIKHTDPVFEVLLETGAFLILPKTAGPDAPRVSIVRPGCYDTEKFNIVQVMAAGSVIQRVLFMIDDHLTVAGGVSIADLEGTSINHLLQITPSLMKKLAFIGQDATPLRMKGAHYLNTPPGFETIFNTMKNFMNEKHKQRLFVHNKNYEELYKHVPKEILPVEYGGNGGTIQEIIDYWKNKIKEYSAFLDEDFEYGTEESKRPGKPRTAEDMFGVDGSFRKLEVD